MKEVMNIVIMNAHPDDAESGCFGLAIKAARAGHRVVALYMTSGIPGAQVAGRPEAEVREDEARAACALCGVETDFLRCPMSALVFDQAHVRRVCDRLRELDADLILAHWPVDSHPDHQVTGALATQAVVGNPGVALAFFEVLTGVQTLAFDPTHFVDISGVAELKKQAVDCHRSQNVAEWWSVHDAMERFRYFQGHGFRVEDPAPRAEAYRLEIATPEAQALFDTRTFLRPSGSRTLRTRRHDDVPLFPPP